MRFWFMGLHTVLECTGHYLTEPTSQMHIAAGAKKVVISAPSKDSIPMFVFGVNHKKYAGAAIVPNASCTTNYLVPVVKVLNDKWGIKRGLMTTVHAATASQMTDEPFSKLDAALRAQLRPWVFAHVRERRIPVVLATHDEQDVAGPKRVLHLRATEESPHHV